MPEQGLMESLQRRYDDYLDGFRDNDGQLPAMLELKRRHTAGVVQNARKIMQGEGWMPADITLGQACALLHDVGRFSQFSEFGTFQDVHSINHAHRGVQVIAAQGWLNHLPAVSRNLILGAIALHNRRSLPATLAPALTTLAHLVRDADKLDIFRVLTTAIQDGSITRHPEIAWGLQDKVEPSAVVIEQVKRGETVSYAQITSLSDFILTQVGWLIGGLYFATSRHLAVERRIIDTLEHYLNQLGNFAGVAQCCRIARDCLARTTATTAQNTLKQAVNQ